ncbi:gamma-glutamyltransferase [Pseudonocardia eucalypti]|uniref:Gamma-glutamyltransferase n=2 Tax=Pseudonocardia eucalypti TaxID=648755 RepID=A0ABP9Q1U7_9PSEU
MAASTHWLASGTAMSVLERGGNAFDAAAAAGFVLQVVEPHMNGPAGEVPLLLWDAREGAAHVVCGQGVAPAAATIAHLEGLGLDLMPGTGPLAATVPGAFGVWTLLLERWGSWGLPEVLDYAISYATAGYPLPATAAATIELVDELFTEHWPTSAAAWLPGGAAPAAGAWMTNPALAETYRRLAEEARGRPSREAGISAARDAWYRGWVAEEIGRFSAGRAWLDTSGREHAGLLTADDLARWSATVEQPVRFDYAGRYQVLKTDLWGQGPVFGQQLALLDGMGLGSGELGYGSPDYLHVVIEAAKLAFADREAWYGDSAEPDTLPLLLNAGYTTQRRALIGPSASDELRPGSPGGRAPRLPAYASSGGGELVGAGGLGMAGLGVGEPTRVAASGRVNGDTCHLDVVDRWGNMVSATPSGGWLQSSPTIPALGFALGTRGQMFALDQGLPNSLRPGARPRTTLSPSFALRDGEPWLAFGTPGGDQQDQWSLHFFLALVHGGLGLQAAIEAPALHSEHFPGSFFPRAAHPGQVAAENRFAPEVLAELRRRGHRVVEREPWSVGRLSAVAREPGHLAAAANPRGSQGYAAGR